MLCKPSLRTGPTGACWHAPVVSLLATNAAFVARGGFGDAQGATGKPSATAFACRSAKRPPASLVAMEPSLGEVGAR